MDMMVTSISTSAQDLAERGRIDVHTSMLQLRQRMYDALHDELVGPAPGLPAVQFGPNDDRNGEEILRPQDSPRLRYGAGILFPQRADVASQDSLDSLDSENTKSAKDETESASADDLVRDESRMAGARSEADTEQEVNRANEYLPSAMGISAFVEVPAAGVRIRVRAARYEQRELEGRGRTDDAGKYHPYNAWWRIPISADDIDIPSDVLLGLEQTAVEREVSTAAHDVRLSVHVFSRPLHAIAGDRAVDATPSRRMLTVTLLNRTPGGDKRPHDQECFFQCRFAIEAADGSSCFLPYPEAAAADASEEEAGLQLLYRDRKVFAVGHGCAADWQSRSNLRNEWEIEAADSNRPSGMHNGSVPRVWSEVLPTFEIPPVVPSELPGVELSMGVLAGASRAESVAQCRRLSAAYAQWIEAQQDSLATGSVPPELQAVANANLNRCRNCLERITAGIDLLASDHRTHVAFALMNKAMLMQQIHYRLASDGGGRKWSTDDGKISLDREFRVPDYSTAKNKWRPFQLAFILMNLRSLVDPSSSDRSIVDVIWFPTGGGKTEAYLGLTAFTLFLRRLKNPRNAGTAVLMRYTLRLLTAQQYQRAASLICACEILRRDDPESLGEGSFSIGLWVGSAVTPNKEAGAVAELRRLHREGTRNPFVVLACPWCGAGMGPVKRGHAFVTPGYRQLGSPQRVRFQCGDSACAFHGSTGLPLLVIDEQIYNEPPSLLIGTVDKFALLPWYPESASLFGVNATGSQTPPELIIQDELHLISGPLGSMVGHYETIIDELCRDARGTPAKIIASTATISRAAEQVHALYARQPFLFPPQALSVGNSFFAEERPDLSGRLYVGVFASGLPSQQTTMVRVLAALLQGPASDATLPPDVVDPYWTLVAYFNSIRELGSTATLVSADIREYLGVMHDRHGWSPVWGAESAASRRFLSARGSLELTGRVSGNAVTDALQQLFVRYEGARVTGGVEDGERRDPPVDVCLATNMIQVGLDVPRLGLMLVAGQPKTTSEYIQATSRVGRNTPGLVVTTYSASKPRDRSHYEHFRAYHESIYRHVEPTSVTPFAVPVRERALHALMVALVRFWGAATLRTSPNPGPSPSLWARVRSVLLSRVRSVDESEFEQTEEMIDRIINEWRRLPASRYGDFAPPDPTTPFMYPSGSQPLAAWQDRSRATPSSMRNVDAECDAAVLTSYPRP